MRKLLVLFLLLPLYLFSQQTEKRLALVIGNAEYTKGALKNPVNDAKLIAKALDSLGFEVLEYYNLTTQRQLKKAILEFGAKRDSANVGFVYYAGHGVQVSNENYLLPTQEEYTTQTEVIEYAVSVQSVLRALKSDSNQVNILVLDACRDNPFESNWSQTRSAQGGTGGLAKIPPPNGSIIAFSTSAGETAADGKGINSDYTLSLYKNILLEDTSLDQVFRNVRAEVFKITNGAQRPLEMTQLTGQTFYLNPGNYDDEFKAIELILEQKKELIDALNILAPIIDDKPENIRAQELLGQSYIALENFSKALETYEILIELDPNNSTYFTQKGACYASNNELDKALVDYNKAVDLDPEDPYNYEFRSEFQRDYLNNYDKALEDYNKAIILKPKESRLHFRKGYLLQGYLEKPDLALNSYLEVERLDPEYRYINNNIAIIYENYIQDYQKALEYYTKEIKLNPSDALAYRNRADLYANQLEDLDKALENFNKAVEVDPENSYNYEMRGGFYRDYLNDYDKALEDYNKGIELNPTDSDLHFNKGYLLQDENPDLALKSYLEAERLDPNYRMYNNIALVYENYIKDYQKAREYFTKEIKLDPSNATAYRNRAKLYASKLEDLDKALVDYNKAIDLDPENSYNYEMRGYFYRDYLNDYDKALEDFNKGVALNPTSENLYFIIAHVYTEYFNNPKLALETLMKMLEFEALETILDSTYLYADIADIYLINLNDPENSLLFYKKEIDRSPQSYYGYFKLAEYYVYYKDYEKAEANYNKALELAPENNNLNLSYINFKYFNANYQEVIQLSKIAIEKDPKDPQGDYITAVSYLKMDNSMKALISLNKSIDKIIDYSSEGYWISDIDGRALDLSEVIMKRAHLYENYKEFALMCDDYNLALTYVKDEDLKKAILDKISKNCEK